MTRSYAVLVASLTLGVVGCVDSPVAPPTTETQALQPGQPQLSTNGDLQALFGSAHGSYATVRTSTLNVLSTPTAPVRVGSASQCGVTGFVPRSASASGATEAGMLRVGAVRTAGEMVSWNGLRAVRMTSSVAGVSLLDGAVTADLVRAVSTSAGGQAHSSEGSGITNLRVNGNSMTIAAPNSRVELPGIGYVVLQQEVRSGTADRPVFTVHMIRVYVTSSNSLGLPAGTQVSVGTASAGAQAYPVGTLTESPLGRATGASVHGGITAGPFASMGLGCGGTDGREREATLATASLGGTGMTGAVRSTAQGTMGTTFADGRVTTRVAQVNLLGGLIQADEVYAEGSATHTPGSARADGSLTNLRVLGQPQSANVAPNTRISLPGVGTLYLRRTLRSSDGKRAEVQTLRVVVDAGNTLGLAGGTVITVGWVVMQTP